MIGQILGAVLPTVIGGIFGRDQAQDNQSAAAAVNAENAAAQERINAQNIALARETQSRNEALARETSAANERLQREFAQMGIRWRTEDAKAAGLHPLFALSGGGAAYSPAPTITHNAPVVQASRSEAPPPQEWLGAMGQNLGRALAAAMDPTERMERALRLRLLEAQIGETEARAGAIRSEAAQEAQSPTAPIPTSVNEDGMPITSAIVRPFTERVLHVENLPALVDRARAKPDEIVSRRSDAPALTAGTHAGMREYNLAPGFNVILPYSEEGPGEALENISWWQWPAILKLNADHYGTDWKYKAIERLAPYGSEINRALEVMGWGREPRHLWGGRIQGR